MVSKWFDQKTPYWRLSLLLLSFDRTFRAMLLPLCTNGFSSRKCSSVGRPLLTTDSRCGHTRSALCSCRAGQQFQCPKQSTTNPHFWHSTRAACFAPYLFIFERPFIIPFHVRIRTWPGPCKSRKPPVQISKLNDQPAFTELLQKCCTIKQHFKPGGQ